MSKEINLKVDTDELEHGRTTVQFIKEDFEQISKDFFNRTGELEAEAWSGVDYNSFKNYVNYLRPAFNEMQTTLEGLENDIWWTRNDYEEKYWQISNMLSEFEL